MRTILIIGAIVAYVSIIVIGIIVANKIPNNGVYFENEEDKE